MRRVSREEAARATTPPGPYEWDDYRCEHGVNQIDDEIDEIVADPTLTMYEVELRLAEVGALVDRAEHGELSPLKEHKPVNVDPEIWEIRFTFGSQPFRIYYAEPQDFPKLLLGLKAHFKDVTGSEAQIRMRQNQQMSKAANRYHAGRTREWLGDPRLVGHSCHAKCVDP
ncbi:hypothetical protein QO003_003531 [Arthrobacter silviterrae]|uniref:Uncharacterized protein n=1 Tax=Arthrobacter silviterrae TaxID=2026658 RepID=A0ABX0D9T5_9MICC|nr:hypothetical protein [Arthrobacter silviterrae]MDQ0279228.1 hypothetical protein [Arthrobacter silviterrae]NGN83653.1 hypothetical protein [Arthrobacter silviterrae]